jgi:hypothetical protein
MPSWNVHLEAGNRIADKLKFSTKEREEFVFGCLLPDINNGYVNHPHTYKSHEETHYANFENPVQAFYDEYKEQIDKKDPIFLGYLFHIFTDDFFNSDFENRIKDLPISKKSDIEQENLKHNDFWLYGTTYRQFLELPSGELDTFVARANEVGPVEINVDDIIELAGIIRVDEINDCIRDNKYILYTKEELDKVLENTCKKFTKEYLEKP